MTQVDAKWVGPGGYDLPPSTRTLDSGEAVYRVPLSEARDSDNWEPLGSIVSVQSSVSTPSLPSAGEDD